MRHPAVAGSFYPATPSALRRQVDELLARAARDIAALPARERPARAARAFIVPHAGYMYSGYTAALAFAAARETLSRPNATAVFVGPNHTGLGRPAAVSFETWATPIGKTETDLALAGALARSPPMERDERAHAREHSIEVQMPFLQAINPLAKTACVCMGRQDNESSARVGEALHEVLGRPEFADRQVVLFASSDFTHYESGKAAEEKDGPALARIARLDDEGFQQEVARRGLSICGHGPIAAALRYARLNRMAGAHLMRYTNSGRETDGREDEVVAYASFWLGG